MINRSRSCCSWPACCLLLVLVLLLLIVGVSCSADEDEGGSAGWGWWGVVPVYSPPRSAPDHRPAQGPKGPKGLNGPKVDMKKPAPVRVAPAAPRPAPAPARPVAPPAPARVR